MRMTVARASASVACTQICHTQRENHFWRLENLGFWKILHRLPYISCKVFVFSLILGGLSHTSQHLDYKKLYACRWSVRIEQGLWARGASSSTQNKRDTITTFKDLLNTNTNTISVGTDLPISMLWKISWFPNRNQPKAKKKKKKGSAQENQNQKG